MSLPLNDPNNMEEKSSLEASGQVTPVEKPEQAQAQPAPANEPPNGGVTAWLQVLGSFILFLNTWYAQLYSMQRAIN